MARSELLPLMLAGGLAMFVAAQVAGGGGAREAGAAVSESGSGSSPVSHVEGDTAGDRAGDVARNDAARSSALDARPDDSPAAREARRRALEAAASQGYLPRLIRDGERIITRWPPGSPVRVWVAPTSSLRGWHPRMVAAAREAFDDWRGVVPVDFSFVADSQDAQVIVTWRDRFDREPAAGAGAGGLVGHARRHYTAAGWIAAAEVALAVHAVDGSPLDPILIRAAALHEVGHVLGLPHSDAPDDIMAPSHAGSIMRLSARDERTARGLYGMGPGSID